MILAVRYCAGYVLGHILAHFAVAHVSVYRCMCTVGPFVYVCLLFSPCLLFVILQHYLLQF